MKELQDWHRLFGVSWEDFFHGSAVKVEVEKDLSLKQQYLDVVIIRLERLPLVIELPDGFDSLAMHNLITFKSHQEALDAWALNELLGHYVNYRKQVSPSVDDLLPEEDFRLFAVCVRYPQNLAGSVTMTHVSQGVYDVSRFGGTIRIVVVNQLPLEKQNAILCLFGTRDEQRVYGARTYHPRSREGSSIFAHLFRGFPKENFPVPYTLADLARDTIPQILAEATTEQRLEGIPAEKRLEGIPAEKRLEGIPVEKRLAGLSPEQLETLRQLLRVEPPKS